MLIVFNSLLRDLVTLIFNGVKILMPVFISKNGRDAAGQILALLLQKILLRKIFMLTHMSFLSLASPKIFLFSHSLFLKISHRALIETLIKYAAL